VGPRVGLDAVVKRKIPSPCRESKPRTPIVQPVAQRYLYRLTYHGSVARTRETWNKILVEKTLEERSFDERQRKRCETNFSMGFVNKMCELIWFRMVFSSRYTGKEASEYGLHCYACLTTTDPDLLPTTLSEVRCFRLHASCVELWCPSTRDSAYGLNDLSSRFFNLLPLLRSTVRIEIRIFSKWGDLFSWTSDIGLCVRVLQIYEGISTSFRTESTTK
jgi:hypothetical protein